MERAEDNPSVVIESIQDQLPVLYFVFGRVRTEELAAEVGREWDFLFPEEKEKVLKAIRDTENEHPEIFQRGHRKILRRLLQQGIGYHHAGLSPVLKNLVERLYESRLIWVLFCTETFAAGVNFPAASTVFHSCRKWDGKEFRTLLNREFFQMAGRAGRRGFDRVGHVYIRVDEKYPEQTGFFNEGEVESVYGRLGISANTVLSLLKWKTDEEIKHYLTRNFSAYQERRVEREIKARLAEIDRQLQIAGRYFCEEKGTAACPMHRRKLMREEKRLHSARYKNRASSRERLGEIRDTLKGATPVRCLHELCGDAQRELDEQLKMKADFQGQLRALQYQSNRYVQEYETVKKLLEELGYVQGREFYPRGNFALELHVQEILVTELVFSGVLEEAEPAEMAAILAGVDYIPGRREMIPPAPYDQGPVFQLREELLEFGVPERFLVWSHLPGFVAFSWYSGNSLDYILERTTLQEGDIVSILRREIDLLRQLDDAAHGDPVLKDKIKQIRSVIDRDEVAVVF